MRFLIALLLLILPTCLLAQTDSLTGIWQGQYDFHKAARTRVTIRAVQNGDWVTGELEQRFGAEGWARCQIEGRIKGDSVFFTETRMLDEHNPYSDNIYCLYRIRGTVRRQGKGFQISGEAVPTGMKSDAGKVSKSGGCSVEPVAAFTSKVLPSLGGSRVVVDTPDSLVQPLAGNGIQSEGSQGSRRPAPTKAPTELERTIVKTVQTFEAPDARIVVEYRDNMTVDGDIVSLNLDGEEWLVRHSALKRNFKKTRFELAEGQHFLILYAENAGNGGKNTATVRITSGSVTKTYDMTSDSGTSSAIRIVRK